MALTCRELIAILGDYCSGSLEVDLAVVAELHLLGCLDCSAYLKSYEETIRLSKVAFSSRDEDAPEELVRAILASTKRLKFFPS